MKAKKIAVIECGADYTNYIDTLYTDEPVTLGQAMTAVANVGYRLMGNADGGCCETHHRRGEYPVHRVTVHPLDLMLDIEPL